MKMLKSLAGQLYQLAGRLYHAATSVGGAAWLTIILVGSLGAVSLWYFFAKPVPAGGISFVAAMSDVASGIAVARKAFSPADSQIGVFVDEIEVTFYVTGTADSRSGISTNNSLSVVPSIGRDDKREEHSKIVVSLKSIVPKLMDAAAAGTAGSPRALLLDELISGLSGGATLAASGVSKGTISAPSRRGTAFVTGQEAPVE